MNKNKQNIMEINKFKLFFGGLLVPIILFVISIPTGLFSGGLGLLYIPLITTVLGLLISALLWYKKHYFDINFLVGVIAGNILIYLYVSFAFAQFSLSHI